MDNLEAELNEAYFGDNRHEDLELKLMPELLKDKDVFVDVGASLGPYTKSAAESSKVGIIYCIEADRARFELLNRNVAEWSKSGHNKIYPFNFCIGAEVKKVRFYTSFSTTSGAINPIKGRIKEDTYDLVQMETLDNLLEREINKRILVKIDIEGAEYSAVKGLVKTIMNNNVELLIEMHSWGDQIAKRYPHNLLYFLKKMNYLIYKTHEHYYFSRELKPFKKSFFKLEIFLWYLRSLKFKLKSLI